MAKHTRSGGLKDIWKEIEYGKMFTNVVIVLLPSMVQIQTNEDSQKMSSFHDYACLVLSSLSHNRSFYHVIRGLNALVVGCC
jgi:hypothetical protein